MARPSKVCKYLILFFNVYHWSYFWCGPGWQNIYIPNWLLALMMTKWFCFTVLATTTNGGSEGDVWSDRVEAEEGGTKDCPLESTVGKGEERCLGGREHHRHQHHDGRRWLAWENPDQVRFNSIFSSHSCLDTETLGLPGGSAVLIMILVKKRC